MDKYFDALECPACGGVVTEEEKICPYCGRSLVLRNDINLMDRKDKNTYITEAAEALHGKKPFLCNRNTIERCIECLDKAYDIQPDAFIDLFRAYVEYDYFERKSLKRKPGYKFYYERASSGGITTEETIKLEKLLKNQIQIGG